MKEERYLTQRDAAILSDLAEELLRVRDTGYNAADALVNLLSSAILLPENEPAPNVVQLYSEVLYRRIGSEDLRSVMLVRPGDTNGELARASVLAPLALALLGRRKGDIVDIRLPFNAVQFVEIVGVGSECTALREARAAADVPGE